MEETKICPFCGKEIIATAKKCKHCGEWLEKQCPCCNEWINIKAKKCKHCGTWLNKFTREKYEGSTASTSASENSAKTQEELEDALEDMKDKKEAGCLMNVECLVILIVFSLFYDWSWWQMGIAIFIGYMLLQIKWLRVLYCIGISIVWACVGLALAPLLFEESEGQMLVRMATDNYGDYWWVALIFGLASLLFHWPAMKSNFNL